jgi:hypothetical protein
MPNFLNLLKPAKAKLNLFKTPGRGVGGRVLSPIKPFPIFPKHFFKNYFFIAPKPKN